MAVQRRYGTRAIIRPGVELTEITIKLAPFGPPVVELTGRCRTRIRRADGSTATVKTGYLGDAGIRFIQEMKDAFGGPEADDEKETGD